MYEDFQKHLELIERRLKAGIYTEDQAKEAYRLAAFHSAPLAGAMIGGPIGSVVASSLLSVLPPGIEMIYTPYHCYEEEYPSLEYIEKCSKSSTTEGIVSGGYQTRIKLRVIAYGRFGNYDPKTKLLEFVFKRLDYTRYISHPTNEPEEMKRHLEIFKTQCYEFLKEILDNGYTEVEGVLSEVRGLVVMTKHTDGLHLINTLSTDNPFKD